MVEFEDVGLAGYTVVVVVVTVVPVWVFVVEDCSVQILVLALKLAQYSHLPRSTTKYVEGGHFTQPSPTEF